ncbi:hypothetical protein AVEN_2509-1 [Araneus ventricosus]|uniref:Reverse transcriptase domain-containing protein n=1 Tax=Araneus ventricosus TaxID=182803 RepID=A0A4Y2GCP6_ARAVE|nr:hypothetical protein AVEN_2509-1 [Araneus ventricosus]
MDQYQHLCRIAGKTWGINKNIRRLLYKTVIERTLCHGAAAWGHNMTSRLQKKAELHSTSVSSLYYWCIQDNPTRCFASGHRSSTPPPTNPTRSNLCSNCSSKIFIQLFHRYIQPNRFREQKQWNSYSTQ